MAKLQHGDGTRLMTPLSSVKGIFLAGILPSITLKRLVKTPRPAAHRLPFAEGRACGQRQLERPLFGLAGELALLGLAEGVHALAIAPGDAKAVSQPVGKITATAFRALVVRIRYPNNDPCEIRLPAPLVVRASA